VGGGTERQIGHAEGACDLKVEGGGEGACIVPVGEGTWRRAGVPQPAQICQWRVPAGSHQLAVMGVNRGRTREQGTTDRQPIGRYRSKWRILSR